MKHVEMTNLEYYVDRGEIWVELWQGKAHDAQLLEEFYQTPEGKSLIDADIKAYSQSGRCHCGKGLDKGFGDALEWFKCVIRNNFAQNDQVADSSHRGSFVTHIPESRCQYNK